MNILTIANLNPKKYGSFEKYCEKFTQYLTAKNHKHYICFTRTPIPIVKEKLLGAGANIFTHNFGTLSIKESLFLFRLIRQYDINIVHMHFYFPYSIFSFLVRFSNVKYFISYRMGLYQIQDGLLKRTLKRIRSLILGIGIDRIFCVSKYSQKIVVNNFQEKYAKTSVVYNGIDLSEYEIMRENEKEKHSDDKLIQIISVANLIPGKGIQYLLQSASIIIHKKDNIHKNKKLKFVIVGDGPYSRALTELSIEHDIIQHVTFLGRSNEIPRLLTEADIAVIPSIVPEGFGFTVVEAMAANLPVVATRSGAIPELIEDGTNGFIVEPSDKHGIVTALLTLISDEELRFKMGDENRKRVHNFFNIERVCQEQLNYYLMK